jgi:hypothetical protein
VSKKKDNVLGWVLLGAGAGLGLWWLLRPKSTVPPAGTTQVLPVPSNQPPVAFANLGAVSSRFDDLRDIYHMGRLTPQQALAQVDALSDAVWELDRRGVGDPQGAQELLDRLESFRAEIVDFIEFKRSLEPPPA